MNACLRTGRFSSAESPAHRATRTAPHVIEKAGPGGREKRSTLGGSISRPDGRREQTFGRRAVSLAGAAGTAHVTPSERQGGLVACHVVCSATGRSEDLGPNRKSGLLLKGNTIHIDESIDAKLSKARGRDLRECCRTSPQGGDAETRLGPAGQYRTYSRSRHRALLATAAADRNHRYRDPPCPPIGGGT